jgi:hypothetical protein
MRHYLGICGRTEGDQKIASVRIVGVAAAIGTGLLSGIKQKCYRLRQLHQSNTYHYAELSESFKD